MSPSPTQAAALSFLVPGLGQLSVGALRRAILFAAPALAVAASAVALVGMGRSALLEMFLRPEVLTAILALNAGLFIYHVIAIVDAYGLARRKAGSHPGHRFLSVTGVALLLALTVALHGGLGVVGYRSYETVTAVFVTPQGDDGWAIPPPGADASTTPSPSRDPTSTVPAGTPPPARWPPEPPEATPTPSPTPVPVPPWAADGRLDLLLVGSDAGPDRWSLRTDTMIVLSVDVASGHAALFGIPRNIVGVPLPPESAGAFSGGRFPRMLNALYVYAMGHSAQFPGGAARGFRAVAGAVQELVGVRLDGAVVVNLAGFARLVDALGGLWIRVPARLVDAYYPLEDGSGHIAIDIKPGCQHLTGRMALAYARSRHQDSDYGRMRRQQAVLIALARQIDPIDLLPQVPELLDVAKQNLWMTVPREDIGGLAELAARVEMGSVKRVLFAPPRYPEHLDSAAIEAIRSVVRSVFDSWDDVATTTPPRACP